jgi:hypothetical protein
MTIAHGPRRSRLAIFTGEDSIIRFKVASATNPNAAGSVADVTTILVRIVDPDTNVNQYTATKDDDNEGFWIQVSGANHSTAGLATGRVLFDGVTQPDSRFELPILEAD